MIKKQKTRIDAGASHAISGGKEGEASRVPSTDTEVVRTGRADVDEIWPLVLRLYRLRLLKAHLRGGQQAKHDLKIRSPIQAALLALMMEVQERRASSARTAQEKRALIHDPLSKELAFALDIATAQISEHIGALLKEGLCTEERCADDRRHAHYVVTEEGRKHLDDWLEREMVLIPAHYQSSYRGPKERAEYAINGLSREVENLLKSHGLLGG